MEHAKTKLQYFKELKENKRTKDKDRAKRTIVQDKGVRTKVWTIGGYSNPIVHCPNMSKLLKKLFMFGAGWFHTAFSLPALSKKYFLVLEFLDSFSLHKKVFCGDVYLLQQNTECLFLNAYLFCCKAISKFNGVWLK